MPNYSQLKSKDHDSLGLKIQKERTVTKLKLLRSQLKDLPNLEFIKNTEGSKTNWHLFGILVPSEHRYWIMDALQ